MGVEINETSEWPMRFYVSGSRDPRPASSGVIFCDGSPDEAFRPGVDLELSHWVPNQTPSAYRADTSTEICLNFVSAVPTWDYDLAVNNHVDVDGILAVFVLVDRAFARQHRELLIQAAEMGDFWGWGDDAAQILFQGLTLIFSDLELRSADVQAIYETCFSRIPALVDQTDEIVPTARASLAYLHESVDLIASGAIRRSELHPRFALYEIPSRVSAGRLERALYAPEFNEPISDKALLWPHARARRDEQKVTLVAVEGPGGWHYDLWFPGYVWADTPHRWRPPGIHQSAQTNDAILDHPELRSAVEALQRDETADGQWYLAETFSAFGYPEAMRRPFPIAASSVDSTGAPAESSLAPQHVAGCFAECSG
jgi:hypothetical protein